MLKCYNLLAIFVCCFQNDKVNFSFDRKNGYEPFEQILFYDYLLENLWFLLKSVNSVWTNCGCGGQMIKICRFLSLFVIRKCT